MAPNGRVNQYNSIYAKEVIKPGIQFGPYPGKDAIEQRFSEWMAFVGKANSLQEANLIAFVQNGQKYYRSLKVIQPFETFRVWDETCLKNGNSNGMIYDKTRKSEKKSLDIAKSTKNNVVSQPHKRKIRYKMELSTIFNSDKSPPINCYNEERKLPSRLSPMSEMLPPEFDIISTQATSDIDSDWIEAENSFIACPECGEEYVSVAGLALHRVTHLQDKQCVVCGKIYRQEEQLQRHLESHSSNFCAKCVEFFGVEFGSEYKPVKETKRSLCMDCDSVILINNTTSVTKKEKKELTCNVCDKVFAGPKSLLVHVNKHNNKYSCKRCGKSFGSYSNLVRHLIKHNDADKEHTCEKCGLKFKWLSKLVEHDCQDKVAEECGLLSDSEIDGDKKKVSLFSGKQNGCNVEEIDKAWRRRDYIISSSSLCSELPEVSSTCAQREIPRKRRKIVGKYSKTYCDDDFENNLSEMLNLPNETSENNCENEKLLSKMADVETKNEDKQTPTTNYATHKQILPKDRKIINSDVTWTNFNSMNLRNRRIKYDNTDSPQNGFNHTQSSICPTIFICADCPQVFTSLEGLTLHQLIHSCEEKCGACGTKYHLSKKLQKHLPTHSSEEIWNCLRCHMLFGSQFSFQQLSSTSSRFPLCLTCDEFICINTNVKTTMATKSENCDGFKCRHCGLVCDDKKRFYAHLNQHLKKFTCKECKKCFGSYEHLARHIIAHTDFFPYKCECCKKKFKWASDSEHLCVESEGRKKIKTVEKVEEKSRQVEKVESVKQILKIEIKKQNAEVEEKTSFPSTDRTRRLRFAKKKRCFCCSDVTDEVKSNGSIKPEVILFTESSIPSCVIEEDKITNHNHLENHSDEVKLECNGKSFELKCKFSEKKFNFENRDILLSPSEKSQVSKELTTKWKRVLRNRTIKNSLEMRN